MKLLALSEDLVMSARRGWNFAPLFLMSCMWGAVIETPP